MKKKKNVSLKTDIQFITRSEYISLILLKKRFSFFPDKNPHNHNENVSTDDGYAKYQEHIIATIGKRKQIICRRIY